MKNLDLLPLSAEVKKRLEEFAKQYRRMAHIVIEVISYDEGHLIVRTEHRQSQSQRMFHNLSDGDTPA